MAALDENELHRIVFAAQSDLGEGILVVDRTQIVYANDAYCRIAGRTREELAKLGSTLDLVVPEDRAPILDRERRRAQGEDVPLFYETTLLRPDGTRVPIEIGLRPAAGGVPGRYVSVVRDVSARRASEAVLRETEERFRRAFSDAATGMAIYDPMGRFTRVNAALCDLLGYSEDEMLRLSYREVTHPEDLEALLTLGRRFQSDHTAPVKFERRYLRKDGSFVWAHVTSSPILDPAGTILYYVTHMIDVSARKTAEDLARKEQVSRRVVRHILRDISDRPSMSTAIRRDLGRSLAKEVTATDLAGCLAFFGSLGAGTLTLERAEGDHYTVHGSDLLEMTPGVGVPTCHIALGFLEGCVARLHGRAALGAEVGCQSTGHSRCRFVVHARSGP